MAAGVALSRTSPVLFGALALACASAPAPPPAIPSWDRGNQGLQIGQSERALWNESASLVAELEKEDLLVGDARLEALSADVVESLAPPLDEGAPDLRVRFVKTPERNASAGPDGVILVSVGLLAALRSEAELAALLGHEIAHVVMRHTLASKQYDALTSSTVDRQAFSRRQEWEADGFAMNRMSAAGYDAAAMHGMLSRLEPEGRPRPIDRVAAWESHPDLRQRIASARGSAPKSGTTPTSVERYEAAIGGMLLLDAELEIEAGDLDRAEAAVDRHLAQVPDSGRAYYLRGEIARRKLPEGHRAPAVRTAYERAVELAPEDPDALRALGLLLREAGEGERARDLLERYLRAAPDAVDRGVIERYVRR